MGYRKSSHSQYSQRRLRTFVAFNIYEEPYKRKIKATSLDEAIKKAPKGALRVEPVKTRRIKADKH